MYVYERERKRETEWMSDAAGLKTTHLNRQIRSFWFPPKHEEMNPLRPVTQELNNFCVKRHSLGSSR